ncbi:FAD-dependent oxidoreductase [Arthrobacter sp. zg-Y820]|uniref:NAD(P)/FAD-dependent oxidoreductase n=1 Tax=unclassified Arthrobacter TaxID=235627 RepID=UPI00253FEE26|nr:MULTISPECIES: FAD-dependent oxidoreductase [unclassified Arthrobacter]MCC9195419.1 FAD-binding oxidoreductase [Arthrobacter sp. zg-Y820]MDK1278278.1 FAD-dependent oxidoreductase [Arthrobacter sp. zg.Y820]WIB10158.1 FAD-dependent oxidoreductase [Arthrobacter sp. zg-Y820]
MSFWHAAEGLPQPRPALAGDSTADVVIVGAGYTGLWTAYYLKQAQPGLDIAVLEARFAGFGASGRNGGWLTNSITGGRTQYVRTSGRAVVGRFQELLNDTVDEVISVAAAEGIDADIVKGGELNLARNPAQLARLQAWAADEAQWPEAGARLLDRREADGRAAVAGSLGGLYQPHCARVQPAKLVRGLARTVEAMGVRLYEDTPVTEIRTGTAVTSRGVVRCRHVLRATEGFTAGLRRSHRDWLPMNSSMIVTEPLPASAWAEIGWNGMEAIADMAHAYMYAQRTADGRIALGGRGVPYRFGSRTDDDGATAPATVRRLHSLLGEMFPAARDTRIEQAWSGVLGVPRDWKATVGLDPSTGVGWAGGYVGTGVAAANLAGRTLRDLVLGEDTELTVMPWVNRTVRRWEPEPLRWLGVRAMYQAYYAADRRENRTRSAATSPLARAADLVSGR